MSEMTNLVETIVKALVDNTEAVEVTEIGESRSRIIELKVAREDVGKIIGKRGIHAQALRTIMFAAGGKLNGNWILEIIEGHLPRGYRR